MTFSCGKCNDTINNRQYLNCACCKISLHLDCANVSTARFYIMEKERKLNWKCDRCLIKIQEIHNLEPSCAPLRLSPPLPIQTNKSTLQEKCKINIPTNNSFEALTTDDNDLDYDSDRTEESISTIENTSIILNTRCNNSKKNMPENVEDMKKIVLELHEKLISAEKEIENLLKENNHLKSQMSQTKTLCRTTPKKYPNPRKNMNKTKLDFSKDFEDSISETSTTLTHQLPPSRNSCNNKSVDINSTTTHEDRNSSSKASTKCNPSEIAKICIISNGSKYNMINIAERNFPQMPNHDNPPSICHYSSPGGGIEQLFNGLDKKLKNFTLNDYCIVFIGESDFHVSENYVSKIDFIRNCVQPLDHTNIIICLPTFKQGKFVNIFNRRIEAFNRILYIDNVKNEYAFILDSNKNLNYTHKMFHKVTASANKSALMTIFKDINNLIYDISEYYNNELSKVIPDNKTFFRA